MSFDARAFKAQFPLFAHPDNQRLVYLDNAATTQRPQAVIDAVCDFYGRYNANTHRSSHRLARLATTMVEQVREQARAFLNARASDEIVFVRGATEALNLLAHSLTADLASGDEILLTEAEHHANLVPWQMVARERGLRLVFLPSSNGVPQLQALEQVLSERTRVVALTGASNALGLRLDLSGVRARLPSGCRLLVDASQLLAHQALDVQALECDFLVGSAHKFYGPTGIGLLYGRREALAALPPWQGGGEMITRVGLYDSDYAAAPHRFEAGTSALASVAGLGAALEWLRGWDRLAMARHESLLNLYLHTELAQLCERLPLRLLTRHEDNVGIAALVPRAGSRLSAADIGHWLDEQDIAVRVGHHCAQPLMDAVSEGGSLRISLAGYTQRDDIDRLLQALQTLPLAASGSAAGGEGSSAGMDGPGAGAAAGAVEAEAAAALFGDVLEGLSVEQLRSQPSWQKRYRQLTRWAALLRNKPEIRTEANRVHGCESLVWMAHRCEDGHHHFAIDTDSRVIRGLAVLLLLLIDGRTAAEIAALELDSLFRELGLEKYLSPSRNNGFRALVERARVLATNTSSRAD